MKKIISICMIFTLLLGLPACGTAQQDTSSGTTQGISAEQEAALPSEIGSGESEGEELTMKYTFLRLEPQSRWQTMRRSSSMPICMRLCPKNLIRKQILLIILMEGRIRNKVIPQPVPLFPVVWRIWDNMG